MTTTMNYIVNAKQFDTATAAVGSLIEGYDAIPFEDEEAALIARYERALELAGGHQLDLMLEATDAVLSDEELAVLSEDKGIPADVSEWTADVPLVLIATDYAPFDADRMPPTGNVAWINPTDEVQFLNSLAECGLVKLAVA